MCDAACYMSQLGSSCARWIGFSTIPTKPPPANVMASTIYLSPSIEWLATTASTTDRFKIANVGSASEREVAGIVEVVQKGIALNRLMRLLRETTTTRHWRSVVMVMMTVIVVVVVAVPD